MNDKFYYNETFLARWLADELTEEERIAFEQHPDFPLFNQIAHAFSNHQSPQWKNKEIAWKEFKNKDEFSKKQNAKVKTIGRRKWLIAVAATVLLLVGFFALSPFSSTKSDTLATLSSFSTLKGEQKTYTLPDNSKVRLNADSKITFQPENFTQKRILELKGEAFFTVKKGQSFTVKTENGVIRVLGTTFNVSARNKQLQVTCYTGKVGVYFDDEKDMLLLNAGNTILAENNRLKARVNISDTTTVPKWTSGESRFIQAKITDVIAELERQFGVEISYPKALEKVDNYNGGFPHGDIETALNIIVPPTGFQYRIEGKKVIIF